MKDKKYFDVFSKPEIDIKTQEEILEYFAKGITKDNSTHLKIAMIDTSYAFVDDMVIGIMGIIPESLLSSEKTFDDVKLNWKSDTLHESAHLVWTGNLRKEKEKWKPDRDGSFREFMKTINIIEDVRIEHIMTQILPQSKKYFVEQYEMWIGDRKFIECESNLYNAFRCAIENKLPINYKINPKGKDVVKKAVDIFYDMNVLNGNWNNVVEAGRKIYKLFYEFQEKEGNEEFKGKKFKELTMQIKGLTSQMSNIDKEQSKKGEKLSQLEKEIDKLKEEGKKEEAKKKEEEREKLKEEIKDLKGKKFELTKERRIKKNKRQEEREKTLRDKGDGKLVDVKELANRKKGKFSDKDKDEIVEEMKGFDGFIIEEEKPKEYEGYEKADRKYDFLKIPEVKEFSKGDVFNSDGLYEKDFGIELEIGDEIASALKRELNLKKSLEKRKTSGMIDMKRVRKQFIHHGGIRDTDIFSRKKKKLPNHTVLVLVDFSGSMGMGNKILKAKRALATLSRTLGKLRVNHSIRGYGALNGRAKIADVIIKDFDKEEVDYNFLKEVFYPPQYYENRDGEHYRFGAELLGKQSTEDKLMIVISDGEPYHGGTKYTGRTAYEDTKHAIQQIENMGIKVLGISIDRSANSFMRKAFKNLFLYDGDKLDDLSEDLTEIYLETMDFRRRRR